MEVLLLGVGRLETKLPLARATITRRFVFFLTGCLLEAVSACLFGAWVSWEVFDAFRAFETLTRWKMIRGLDEGIGGRGFDLQRGGRLWISERSESRLNTTGYPSSSNSTFGSGERAILSFGDLTRDLDDCLGRGGG